MNRLILASFLLLSCGEEEKGEEDVEYEGDDAGECSDGADNDMDGYFDCQDNGCWGSPDCEGTGTGSGDGGGSGSGSGSGSGDGGSDDGGGSGDGGSGSGDGGGDDGTDPEAIAAHLTSFELTYSLSLDFDTFGEAYFEDCDNQYAASGSQVEAADARATFEGPWGLESTSCSGNTLELAESIAWVPDGGTSYASFLFDGSIDTLDTWIQHRDLDDTTPLESPSSEGQWYITEMATPVESGLAVYTEQEEVPIDGGLITITIGHVVTVQFDED